jgi:hypothetical protein
MKTKITALMLLASCASASAQTASSTLSVRSVFQRLSMLANNVIAIRGRVTEKIEAGVPPSFYIDEITEDCRAAGGRQSKTARIALFEWPDDGRPLPKGYEYNAGSITAAHQMLKAQRRPPDGGRILVTVIGVLLVGENYAAKWVKLSGRGDAFANRPYAAELLCLAMRDPTPN